MNREEGSRGLAYFEVSNLKIMGEIRKSYDLKQACELQDVISELKTSLSTIIKFVMPSLYKDWSQYLQKFTKHGGIIQATPIEDKAYITFPSVSFMIEPDGQVNYITSSDSLHSCNYLNAAGFFPQLSLSQEDVINILKTLSKSLYSKKLYGHFTVQFAAFADRYKESLKPIPWAVDLSFGMNRMVPVYYYFHFLMGGTLDITTGKYFAQNTEEEIENEDNNKLGDGNIYHLKNSPRKHMTNELYAKLPNKYEGDCPIFKDFNLYDTREFIFSWEMWHPSLAALDLKTFFHMCRYEGISYDLEQGQGTVFIIYDLLKYGYIGCMCISSKREFLLKSINHVFTFLLQHTGPPPQVVDDYNGKEYRPFSELIAKIRLVEKRSKKTKSKKRIIDQILQD
jgi:IQ domain-containing protein H